MQTSWDGQDLAKVVSWLSGWIYFIAWSVSFYPQLMLNIKRRSTHGLTPDFPLLNVFGFGCYTATTVAFLFSPSIRAQYALRHPSSPEPTVRINDLAFGAHALFFCILTYSQFWSRLWGWKQEPGVRRNAQKLTLGVLYGSLLGAAVTAVVVTADRKNASTTEVSWQWIDVIYALSFVKIVLTIFKYIPQVMANFHRKSTIGWSIHQQLLDLTGGVFSLLQLIIDSSLQADWSGITGNPLKFGLANVSMVFDLIFIIQHFVLYGPVEEDHGPSRTNTEEGDALLGR